MGCRIVFDGVEAGFVEIGLGSYWGQFLPIFPSSPTTGASSQHLNKFFFGKAPQFTILEDMHSIQSRRLPDEAPADGEFAN